MPQYRLEIVNRQPALERTVEILLTKTVFALDIETVEWWNRSREKIALVQIAYRNAEEIKVVIVDALAGCELSFLRDPLESAGIVKAIHNAAFDATKLFAHYRIKTAPIYDTMLAARQSGEKRYSLQSQAAAHLNFHLDKGAQRSDWSRRPLDLKQLDYAARDAFSTLLLYENQRERNLMGHYSLKVNDRFSNQLNLPLGELGESEAAALSRRDQEMAPRTNSAPAELMPDSLAILSIVNQMPNRYSPEQLSASVGIDRVGIAGWVVDNLLGRETDFDEESAKLVIGGLIDRQLIRLNEYRRLVATEQGTELWQRHK